MDEAIVDILAAWGQDMLAKSSGPVCPAAAVNLKTKTVIVRHLEADLPERKKEIKRMASVAAKPHAVCIPYPAQGHITPLLHLAKLLHFNGFHITFVNTDYNHRRLLKSRGPNSLAGLPDFCFKSIPDGLPNTDVDATQDIPSLCEATEKNCLVPFRKLLAELNSSDAVPPVTCVVADAVMSFTLDVAEELGIPEVVFWTPSACGVLGYMQYHSLVERGLVPLKDESCLTNGYMDMAIDWIPGMKTVRLKDLPSFIRTTDINDIMLNTLLRETSRTCRASAVILNTFEAFERDVLNSLSTMFPPILTLGPISSLVDQIPSNELKSIASNLWKEEAECIKWLDTKESNSVVYVNFGSITVMTKEQVSEFAWGLANSKKPFLWIIRADQYTGDSAILPPEFLAETMDRGMLAGWCPQEQVLKHPSTGGFLSHMGWNSTIESVNAGVPLLCWPFFAEQPTNCWFACNEWGIGMEIDSNVKRNEVEKLVRQLMDGEKGKEMKRKAIEWKKMAGKATTPGGSSYENIDKLVEILLGHKQINPKLTS